MTEPEKKPGRGCLFYGGIVAGTLFLFILLAVFLGYRYATHLLNEYTDTQPMTLPVVKLSDQEIGRLRDRIAAFSKAVDEGRAVEALTISADEVNALIETDTNLTALKGHFFVTLEESNHVNAQLSFPCDRLGFRPLRGRYLNASGAFSVSFTNGALWVSPETLFAKGRPLPENFMQQMRLQNFAENWNEDPKTRTALSKLQEVQVKPGVLIIVPRKDR